MDIGMEGCLWKRPLQEETTNLCRCEESPLPLECECEFMEGWKEVVIESFVTAGKKGRWSPLIVNLSDI